MSSVRPAYVENSISIDTGAKSLSRFAIVHVFVLALLARLLAMPFATLDSGDSASRVMAGWQWGTDPFVMTEGVWGPLHFYLIGAVLQIWPDPVWAPLLLHVLLGACEAAIVYKIAQELSRSDRAAMFAGCAFAAYPMAIHTSLGAYAETPFGVCLGLALLFAIRASRPESRLSNGVYTGILLGLASMIRYEAWMLMPFLTLLLLPRWKQIGAFLPIAIIHPVFWMAGNFLAHGDPLYSVNYASNWELNMEQHMVSMDFPSILMRIWSLVMITARGLSLPLCALIILAIVRCLLKRTGEARWLVLPLALFSLLLLALSQGSIWVKPSYTATFGLLLIPFTASFFVSLGIERWSTSRFAATLIAVIASIGVFAIKPLGELVPRGRLLFSQVIPEFLEQDQAREVTAMVGSSLTSEHDALVSDFFGWHATGYVALHSKLPPAKICVPNGAPTLPVDTAVLSTFLNGHHQGVLITHAGGKLSTLLKPSADNTAMLAGVQVRLSPIGSVPWPHGEESSGEGQGPIAVARYQVVKPSDSTPKRSCEMNCPLTFCSQATEQ